MGISKIFMTWTKKTYRYLQVRHYLENTKRTQHKSISGIIEIFLKAYRAEPRTKIVSKIFMEIQSLIESDVTYIKEKWEKDGGLTLQLEEWEEILEGNSKCLLHGENLYGRIQYAFLKCPRRGRPWGGVPLVGESVGQDKLVTVIYFGDVQSLLSKLST